MAQRHLREQPDHAVAEPQLAPEDQHGAEQDGPRLERGEAAGEEEKAHDVGPREQRVTRRWRHRTGHGAMVVQHALAEQGVGGLAANVARRDEGAGVDPGPGGEGGDGQGGPLADPGAAPDRQRQGEGDGEEVQTPRAWRGVPSHGGRGRLIERCR